MKKVGFVGWRGMVGSVLMERMFEEDDFQYIEPYFFSTSSIGGTGPKISGKAQILKDAHNNLELGEMDIIVTCQGSEYTKAVYHSLREKEWDGYWIDAASALRMNEDACIILDPVNHKEIHSSIKEGCKLFVGGNCSITLSLIGLAGLFQANLVEWMSLMTYQSASGAGAASVRELIEQTRYLSNNLPGNLINNSSVLPSVQEITKLISSSENPVSEFGAPLLGSVIPWVDTDLGDGNSREEWKGEVEANKILGLPEGTIKVNGICVRVGVVRCHSAAITIKLKRDLSDKEFSEIISNSNEWVEYVANSKTETVHKLTPAAIAGTLKVGVGRFKKLGLNGESIYSVFTVGDQLLWGAAEPLRRMLKILVA